MTTDDLTGFEETWRQLARDGELEAVDPDETLPVLEAPPGAATSSAATVDALPRLSLSAADAPDAGAAEPATPDSGEAPDLQLGDLIGEGGMGRVHSAFQRSLRREVAIKRAKGGGDAEAHLVNEALISSELDHPSVLPVHALGLGPDGEPVMVLKRARGVTWQALIDDDEHGGWVKRQPERELRQAWHLVVLIQVCNAVAFAHSRGVVHRDIKPDNVICGEFGEVYLMDWGLARRIDDAPSSPASAAADAAALVGTPADMAPEVVSGDPADERTDVYLLGATLHRLLTGTSRHRGSTLREVLRAAFESAPIDYPPDVPADLAQLANRATARSRDARPSGALAFRNELSAHLRRRGAVALCASADARRAQVRALLAETKAKPAGVESSPATVALRQLITECRFGYEEALRQWPEGDVARAGLEACIEALLELELHQRHVDAARAALAQLEAPRDELTRAVEALEREVAEQQAEQSRLRDMAREIDPAVSAPFRTAVLVAVFGLVAAMLAMSYVMVWSSKFQPSHAVIMRAVLLMVTGSVALIWRQRLLSTRFNRRFVGWALLIIFGLLLNKLLAITMAVNLAVSYVTDMGVLATLTAAGALFLSSRLWAVVLIVAAGIGAAVLRPAAAQVIFGASTVVSMVVTVIALRGAAARAAAEPSKAGTAAGPAAGGGERGARDAANGGA